MLSHFHLNTRYNYNYIKRSLTTNFPNYEGDISNLGYIKKRSFATDFPNYVRATYTMWVTLYR